MMPITRASRETNIEQLIQVLRALRTDFQPYQPIHDPIDTTGIDKLAGDVSLRDFLTW